MGVARMAVIMAKTVGIPARGIVRLGPVVVCVTVAAIGPVGMLAHLPYSTRMPGTTQPENTVIGEFDTTGQRID
jgi:hypothetical protein